MFLLVFLLMVLLMVLLVFLHCSFGNCNAGLVPRTPPPPPMLEDLSDRDHDRRYSGAKATPVATPDLVCSDTQPSLRLQSAPPPHSFPLPVYMQFE